MRAAPGEPVPLDPHPSPAGGTGAVQWMGLFRNPARQNGGALDWLFPLLAVRLILIGDGMMGWCFFIPYFSFSESCRQIR